MSSSSRSRTSYAAELLHHSLEALSTVDVGIPEASGSATPSERVSTAARDLATAKPPTPDKLAEILRKLDAGKLTGQALTDSGNPADSLLEADVTARAVTLIWKETMDSLMESAHRMSEELQWWESVVRNRRYVGLYFVQTLPLRLLNTMPEIKSVKNLHLSALRWPRTTSLFNGGLFLSKRQSLPQQLKSVALPITNPVTLTRREILANMKDLRAERDRAAELVGFMATQAPKWEKIANVLTEQNVEQLVKESTRIYALLCVILGLPIPVPERIMPSNPSTPVKRTRAAEKAAQAARATSPSPGAKPAPSTLLSLLDTELPKLHTRWRPTLESLSRPNFLTRYWIAALVLPPAWIYVKNAASENREWILLQIRNARETGKGWLLDWVISPLEDVATTLRTGGEGLGVAPATVNSDKESLQRMVLDLGRDHFHMSGEALEELGRKVTDGNMEDVLRVYEAEMKNPVKNALMGDLVRTLLIQVQKTKVDLSLSLLSLDRLLKSQQLTFAFVGLAPSLLALYGIGGWVRQKWRGEKRGKARLQAWARDLRVAERILIVSGKRDQHMTDCDKGLLLLSVASMRSWAHGISSDKREDLLDDLRLLENPELSRNDKLVVVGRIWRSLKL